MLSKYFLLSQTYNFFPLLKIRTNKHLLNSDLSVVLNIFTNKNPMQRKPENIKKHNLQEKLFEIKVTR